MNKTQLSKSRIDIVNNYHARMLSSAILAAQSEHLEYVQLVSFGCGHDAYLSDEITKNDERDFWQDTTDIESR